MEPRDAYRKINLLRFLEARTSEKDAPKPEPPKDYNFSRKKDCIEVYLRTTRVYYRGS